MFPSRCLNKKKIVFMWYHVCGKYYEIKMQSGLNFKSLYLKCCEMWFFFRQIDWNSDTNKDYLFKKKSYCENAKGQYSTNCLYRTFLQSLQKSVLYVKWKFIKWF